eukprot:Polyplicarium_translucidae@DN1593_c0_g1_i1.p1
MSEALEELQRSMARFEREVPPSAVAPKHLPALKQTRERLVTLRKVAAVAERFVEENAVALREEGGFPLLTAAAGVLLQSVGTMAYRALSALSVGVATGPEHPSAAALVEMRFALEKFEALERKAAPKVDRIVREAAREERRPESETLRPNPDALEASDEEPEPATAGEGERLRGAYKPPMILAADFVGDPDARRGRAERRENRELSRLLQTDTVRLMQEELADAPEEIAEGYGRAGSGGTSRAFGTRGEERRMRDFERTAAAEEESMMRVRPSKKDRSALKRLRREPSGGVFAGATLDQLAALADTSIAGGDVARLEAAQKSAAKRREGEALKRRALKEFRSETMRPRERPQKRHKMGSAKR